MVLLHSNAIPLGSAAPSFHLMGIDGAEHSLEGYRDKKVLVIIFMCNHCPFVQEIWEDLVALEKRMPEEVQFLGINSNANPNYPEDSFEKMKEYARAKAQEFPYLYDENQGVAKLYDAQCTPDIFVYNAAQQLAYHGAFSGLEAAVQDLLKGKEPAAAQTHSMGCSIKWA
ncbi:MAG: thioredoxin family protein [Candidatus Gracilibacteria bacterium]|jgi:peroxiredoxin